VHALRRSQHRFFGLATSLIVAVAGTVVVLLGTMSAAHADQKCVRVNPRTGECTLWITIPGTNPTPGPSDPPSTGNTGDSGQACYWDGTSQGITNPPPGPVPCTKPGYGYWSNSYNCYIQPLSPPPPASDPSWQGHQPGDGAVYQCYQPQTQIDIHLWLQNPPAGPGQQLTPLQVAQIAIKQINMQAINVGMAPTPTESNPNAMGVIGVPVWMWVENPDASTWGTITKSVSAGGITVTVKAYVEQVRWDMGDGSNPIKCGQGTPYNSAVDGTKSSPDCGYTYQKTSWDKPHHEYTVTANSYWRVDWAGAGQQGTIRLPALVSTVHIREGELQVLNNQG
jgi:hypothetical protein